MGRVCPCCRRRQECPACNASARSPCRKGCRLRRPDAGYYEDLELTGGEPVDEPESAAAPTELDLGLVLEHALAEFEAA